MFILQDIRNKKNLSRRELSLKSNVPQTTIISLELGKNNPNYAKLDTLIKLAKALNVKVKDFFPNENSIG